MYILGLNIGHNATACLAKNGQVIGCVSEERFSRVKNHSGIPLSSIRYLLDTEKIPISEVDYIVLDNQYGIDTDPDFGKRFLEAYTKKPLKNRILSKIGYNHPREFFRHELKKKRSLDLKRKIEMEEVKNQLSKKLMFSKDKILVIDHHLAHALSVCYNLPKNEKTLVFTLDGEGAGYCASVNVFDGKSLKTISKTLKSASLGYLYSIATIYLGMKPLEHEFKVMGLAPYAKKHNVDKIYGKFAGLIKVNERLEFESRFNMPFADYFFFDKMKYQRFDSVAGAVQRLVEDLVCDWVTRAIKQTGIRNVALAGGVFMNVKANQRILEMPEVKSLFVMPSAGDESNAIGASYYGGQRYCKDKEIVFKPKPVEDLYLGPEYNEDYVDNMIKRDKLNERYNIRKIKRINVEVAKLLAKGEIVARCSGKSEWGARALGNRSILSNASHQDTIRILNETIKDRDFWMPFTPSIIDKYANKYFVNKKNMPSPYMVITFNSTEKGRKEIPAAMHPYDFTVRPQVVTKKYNPDYYEIIERFSKITGAGGILNTSFNLHGEPNVLTPEDAIHTLDNSSLKYLAVGNHLFEKKWTK